MTRFLTALIAVSSLATLEASASQLEKLFPAVKTKIEKYCPQVLSNEDTDALRNHEMITLDEIDYFADEAKKAPTIGEEETLVLCSGKFAQNRSTPARVECSFCKEDKTNSPILSINLHITRDVEETFAKQKEEKELELSQKRDESTDSTEIQS